MTLPAARRGPITNQAICRRVNLIWALLLFNGLAYAPLPMSVNIPGSVGKLLTQAALALAFILVFTVNRRHLFRPNVVLTLLSILAVTSLMASMRAQVGSGVGSTIRSLRLMSFVAVLWMLTPWWGRGDRLLLKAHLRCLLVLSGSVVLGLILAPGRARAVEGRLSGIIWPIPSTQVAHYAAVMAGLVIVLWLSGTMRRQQAIPLSFVGVGIMLLTHTRTALLGLLVGLVIAGASLLITRRQAQKAFLVALIVAPVAVVGFTPGISSWLARGQDTQQINGLSGRARVWTALTHESRPTVDRVLGSGLSNKSFKGLPIDSSWLATYQDQGFVGDALIGAVLVFLLLAAIFRPPDVSRALALFLVVYCAVASYTETGLGDVSPYLLDLTLAASLLAPPATPRAQEGW
jgi:hypothetical protein